MIHRRNYFLLYFETITIERTLKMNAGIIDGRRMGKGTRGQSAAHPHPVISPATAPFLVTFLLKRENRTRGANEAPNPNQA